MRIAERIAIDPYRELIRDFGDHDPTTSVMLNGIPSVEENMPTTRERSFALGGKSAS